MRKNKTNKPHPMLARFAPAKPALDAQASTLYAQALEAYARNEPAVALRVCVDQIFPLAPQHVPSLALAGVCAYLLGRLAQAERLLCDAARLADQDARAEIYTNLGLTYAALHREGEAEAAYRKAVALDPQQAQAWNNLGNIVSGRPQQVAQALECYRKALAVKPGYASAHVNLGFALQSANDLSGAERHFRKGIALQPRNEMAWINLVDLLKTSARYEEALALYAQALQHLPGNVRLTASWLGLRRELALWDDADQSDATLATAALCSNPQTDCAPLHLLAAPEFAPPVLRTIAANFARHKWTRELQQPALVQQVHHDDPEHLRIAYLSPDFRNHPVTHLIQEVIAAHDRQRQTVHLYAYGPQRQDRYRAALQSAADHFCDISDLSDAQAAQRIADDRIDILVDLAGYTTHARAGISALRPAPVIVSWLGYMGTLGEPRLADYVLGDAIATPLEAGALYSEAIAQMPLCFQPNTRWQPVTANADRASQGLPEGALVLCSFNQTFKLHPALWDDWCAILRSSPRTVLWLVEPDAPGTRQRLQQQAQARGVDASRLVFAPRVPLEAHRARVALADLALDTYPYNSGTTASDTLRAGVPLLCILGESLVSRMAASLNSALGQHSMVVPDRQSYIQRAICLCNAPDQLAAVRAQLQSALPQAALYDPVHFARDLGRMYQAMHRNACAGRREPIVLPAETAEPPELS